MKKQIQGAATAVIGTALATGSAALGQQAVQWKVSDGGNGHWYRDDLTAVAQTLAARNAAAATIGGHLATVTSQAEHAFVISVAFPGGSLGLNDTWPALGGFRLAGSTQWQWVTGEPFTYAPFSPDPPQYDIAEWLMMWGQGFTPLLWWTGNGNPTLGRAIIEWSADCNNDGIVDYGQCRDGSLPDYNGNNIPDCCETGTQCVTSSYPLQWRTAEGGNSHWYRALPDGSVQDWDRAKLHAESVGGYLASVTSAAESDFVWSRLASKPNCWTTQLNFSGPALGGYLEEGQWRWLSGEPWDFNSWGPCFSQHGEQRLHYGCNAFSNEWNDLFSWDTNIGGAIIEWSADCNNDGIVDYGQILDGTFADLNTNGIPDVCEVPTCADADLFADMQVNGADLGILLAQWGEANSFTVSDLNGDALVDGSDLGILLSFWGPCTP